MVVTIELLQVGWGSEAGRSYRRVRNVLHKYCLGEDEQGKKLVCGDGSFEIQNQSHLS